MLSKMEIGTYEKRHIYISRVLASLMAPRITRYSQFSSKQKVPDLPELKKE